MSEAFDHTARRWLSQAKGSDCQSCGRDDWHVSDPAYPIIQFRCQSCGHIVRTDLTSIEQADV